MLEKVHNIAENLGEENSPLDYKPEITLDIVWYWQAFQRLHQSRGSSGFGPSPISISDIKDYCEVHNITSTDEVCQVVDYIQAMDSVYISRVKDDMEEDNNG